MNPYAEPGELIDLLPRPPSYLTPAKVEQMLLALDFLRDCCHPEQYGHALPPDMIRRASRILKHAQ